jgi:hypothetical protein
MGNRKKDFPPGFCELRGAPLIFANAVKIDVREAMVWIALLVRCDEALLAQGTILMNIADFSDALANANLAALLGGVTPSGKPAIALH